jgi:hypothetical protein
MHAFVAYHAQGKHRERYGNGNFRVITVTPTRQRALNLCRKLQDAGIASKRFWFASIEPISHDEPERILEKIFCTPKDHREGVLYGFGD